jgi:hypothetical protein
VKREDKRESLRSATEILKLDPEKAKTFETTVKELMKSYEMLKARARWRIVTGSKMLACSLRRLKRALTEAMTMSLWSSGVIWN